MEKFIQDLTIQSAQTDQFGKASVCALFHFMLEAAWAHAQVMDWGYEDLQQHHMFWVLSRLYMEIEQYPSWQDEIVLNTWSAGTDGMYAYREFILRNRKGEIVLKANTAWLILNLTTKRIVRLNDYKETFPKLATLSPCREPQRLRPAKPAAQLNFLPVLFSDLDINKHFNSVKSLERVIDHFGIDFLNHYEPSAIEINYLKEGLAGDTLAVSAEQTGPAQSQASVVRENDQATISVLQISWRPRNDR